MEPDDWTRMAEEELAWRKREDELEVQRESDYERWAAANEEEEGDFDENE